MGMPKNLLSESKHGVGASLLTKNELGSIPSRAAKQLGAVVGYGVALQASCLEGFDSLGLHQFYLYEALSGCVHGLGPCGLGSNPSMETIFRIATANIKNLFLKKSQKMLSCFICSISIMVILRFCSPAIVVRFLDGAPS